MHTYFGKIINPKKISLLMDQNNCCANTILIKIIENNIDYIKCNYDFLYEYYIYIYSKIKIVVNVVASRTRLIVTQTF